MVASYSEEKAEHIKKRHQTKNTTFIFIWKTTSVYIICTYISSILIDTKIFNDKSKETVLDGYLKSIFYVSGLYFSNNDTHFVNFYQAVSGYVLILIMLILEKYLINKSFDYYNKLAAEESSRDSLNSLNSGDSEFSDLSDTNHKNTINDIEEYKKIDDPLTLLSSPLNLKSVPVLLEKNSSIDNSELLGYKREFEIIEPIKPRTFTRTDKDKFNSKIHKNFKFPNFFTLTKKRTTTFSNKKSIIKENHVEEEIKVSKTEDLDIREINTRHRKNASYKKLELLKYSLEFQIGIKKLLEEIILFLTLVSCITKLNILSFIYFTIVLIIYKTGNKLKSIYYMACIYFFFFIIQYAIFTSNISNLTCISPNVDVLNDVSEYLNIPWYHIITGNRWGMFFSLGVTSYQISTLWMDFLLILIVYFYIEYFSFAIFETEYSINSNKICIDDNKSYRLANFSKEEIQNFKTSMKYSYDIDIVLDLSQHKRNSNCFDSLTKKYTCAKNKDKETNKILLFYKTFKRYVYLTFHSVTLTIILIFSMMNNGLISIPYIVFSLVYIYKTHNFLMGNKWTFQFAIRYFLKPILFLDLTGQLFYQIPFEYFIVHQSAFRKAMGILGFETLISYNSPASMLNSTAYFLALLKIITYLLVSIQEIIYSSKDFKQFIVNYHLKMKEKSKTQAKLHAFIFNNSRILLMNKRIRERKNIDDTLKKIENQLTKWNEKLNYRNTNPNIVNVKSSLQGKLLTGNKKLTRKRNMAIYKRDILSSYRSILNSEPKKVKKLDDFSIKKILKRDWLIKVCIYLHEQSTLLLNEKLHDHININRILKGHMNITSELEEYIEQFEKENENKYNTLNNLKKSNSNRNSAENIKNLSILNRKNSIKSETSIISEKSNEEKSPHKQEEIINDINELNEQEADKPNSPSKLMLDEDAQSFNSHSSDSKSEEKILEKKTSFELPITPLSQLKNEERDEILDSTEYFELEGQIKIDFFSNYCSRVKIFQFIFYSIIRYFAQNFEYVCYFVMILNHAVYCSLISVVWPVLVFTVGILHYPKPRKFFWKVSIIYCGFIICFKFLLQFSIWTVFFKRKADPDEFGSYNFKDYMRIGIELYDSAFCFKFFKYIIFDFILMSFLIAHQFMLIRKGLWDFIEIDIESVEEAYDRIMKNNPKSEDSNLNNDFTDHFNFSSSDSEPKNKSDYTLKDKIKFYFSELFPKMRNQKPGKDFYVGFTLSQIIILIFIIFFYTKMDQDKTVYNDDSIKLKQFSGNMVVFSFIHVFLVVLERYIHLKNARKVLKIEYNVYDTYTGSKILSNNKNKRIKGNSISLEEVEELKTYEDNERFEINYLQHEALHKGLIYKYILQLVLVIFVHIYIFWYLPITGNVNLHNSTICENDQPSCNEFSNNHYLQFFYFIYCIYFLFSGLQIKFSMIDLRKQSALMKGDNLFYSVVFKTFKAIPFVYELKLLIDWTFTETALDLFKWLKFESIYDLLFITKCDMKGYYSRRLGTKIPGLVKFFAGGLFFSFMLIIVFGPLVLFSSLNPTNKPNKVLGASVELQLAFVKNNISINYTLFKSNQLDSIYPINDYEWNDRKFNEIVETKNYDQAQVQVIKMLVNSEKNWEFSDLTYEFISTIMNGKLEYDIFLNMKYSFRREVK